MDGPSHFAETFAETDEAVLHALIAAHPLGAWVTLSDGELIVNHVPFLVDRSRGGHGTLVGHVARANPVWRTFSTSVPSVVVFQGPQTYVTPSWYPSKHAHGRAVPTWNYVVVHAHGVPTVVEDDDAWKLAHLGALTDAHESAQALPWKLSDAPEDFVRQMIKRIVGIEIPVDRLDGKWKVSQNRSEADRLGVVAGLLGNGGARQREMAELVRERLSSERAKPPSR